MNRTIQRLTAAALALTLAGGGTTAWSQENDPGYQSWGDDNQAQLRDMVQELRDLIGAAESARAADPRFLDDLKALADEYDRPGYGADAGGDGAAPQTEAAAVPAPEPAQSARKPAVLINDDFADGDFTQDVQWTVISGDFKVEDGFGLRSVVGPTANPAAEQPAAGQGGGDPAAEIIGGILNQVLTGGEGRRQQETEAPAPAEPAEIRTRLEISNSFGMRINLSARPSDAAAPFRMGPFQTDQAGFGYKLVYRPDAASGLAMIRHSPSRETEIASLGRPLSLEDNTVHRIDWVRKTDGSMTVSLDGTEILQVTDTAFRDPFDGFALVNEGGDYAIRSIALTGLK